MIIAKKKRRRLCAWCQLRHADTYLTAKIGKNPATEYALHAECKKEMTSWLAFRRDAGA